MQLFVAEGIHVLDVHHPYVYLQWSRRSAMLLMEVLDEWLYYLFIIKILINDCKLIIQHCQFFRNQVVGKGNLLINGY